MPSSDVTIFQVDAGEPGGTDTTFNVTGASASAMAGAVTSPNQSTSTSVNITGAQASAAAGSIRTGTGLTTDFPRIGLTLIGSRNYMLRNAEGVELREALATVDYAIIGLFDLGPWDTGDPNYLQREEFYTLMRAAAPNQVLVDYTDCMETDRNGRWADEMYDNTGPSGAQNFWVTFPGERDYPPSVPVNDWWGRQGSGEMKSTFGGGDIINRNITDYVTVDGSGRRVPQVYGDRIIANHFANISTPKDITGVGLYCDVMDHRPRSSTFDFNGDGSNDNARSQWNVVGTQGYTSCVKWREGHAAYVNRVRATYPNIIVCANTTTHSREYSGTDMSVLPYVYPEYQGLLNGGIQEGCSLEWEGWIDEAANQAVANPFSGVYSDGSDYQPRFGDWQMAYNGYVQDMLSTEEPHLCLMNWVVDIVPPLSTNPGAGTVWDLADWALASALMDDGYCDITGSTRSYGVVPRFDAYGTVNQQTTGLTKGWLGQPLEPPQRAPRFGSLWWRRFQGGIAILNSDNRGTNPARVVPVVPDDESINTILAGQYRRIDGYQNPSKNNGSVVNQPFPIAPKTAYILQVV
jgi:hypothetical protein